jgi:membrane protease YdiL (CAAX protease family)
MFLEKSSRGANNRWYIYVATLLVVFLAMQVASIPVVIYSSWGKWGDILSGQAGAEINTRDNIGLALLLLSYVVAFFVLLACIKYLHGKRPVDAFTGRDRFDFKRCLHALVTWGGVTLLATAIQYALKDHSTLRFQFDLLPFLGTCLVLVLFLPFQVAWEECLFRGYLMQGFTALFKYRWVPLVLTSLIFGLMHGTNPEVKQFGFWTLMPQYILMGLILGYVAIKDNGIELALGLHLGNNLLAASLVTHESSALQARALFVDTAPTASLWDAVILLACGIVFIWICNRKYHFISNNNLREKVETSAVAE